jgi:hypothetical protein
VQLRNVIRLAVAVAALGTLVIAVLVFHAGGDVHTAGNLARASGGALALVIASLGLEIGRAVDALATAATGQEARLQGYENQIEREAERVRKLCAVGQAVACLLFIPLAALVWYCGNYLTALMFGTPDTRFIMTTWDRYLVGIVYFWTLMPVLDWARFVSMLLAAKAYPLAAARVASQERTVIQGRGGSWRYPISRIAYFRLSSAFLAACLLASLVFAVSYVRVADGGIGVVYFPGTTEAFHPWTNVSSITEIHSFGRSNRPTHGYLVQFGDGSEWRYDGIYDDSSHILQPDPGAALMFAANRAKLPFRCHW